MLTIRIVSRKIFDGPRTLIWSALVLLAAMGYQDAAQAAQREVGVSYDGMVFEGNPSQDYCSSNNYQVGAYEGDEAHIYIAFEDLGLEPSDSISEVVLWLYKVLPDDLGSNDNFAIQLIDDPWSCPVTWNTRPSLGLEMGYFSLAGPDNEWYDINLPVPWIWNAVVGGWWGLAIVPLNGSTTLCSFASEESSGDDPYLEITYDPGAFPDLVVSEPEVPGFFHEGVDLEVSCDVCNQGGDADSSELHYYLNDTADLTSPVYVDDDGVIALGEGDCDNESDSIQHELIEANFSPGSTFFVVFVADANDDIEEDNNEDNNIQAVEVQYAAAPEITVDESPVIECDGDEIWLDLYLEVTNTGGTSDGGTVTVSIPEYDDATPDVTLSNVGDTDPDFGDGSMYLAGDQIFDNDCQAMVAEYLMFEFTDPTWEAGETNVLHVRIAPRDLPVTVQWRATLSVLDANCEFVSYPGSGSLTDQQGWPVIPIDVDDFDDEYEGDDSIGDATLIGGGTTMQSHALGCSDEDHYRVDVPNGQDPDSTEYIRFTATTETVPPGNSIRLTLLDESGDPVIDPPINENPSFDDVEWLLPEGNTFYVRIDTIDDVPLMYDAEFVVGDILVSSMVQLFDVVCDGGRPRIDLRLDRAGLDLQLLRHIGSETGIVERWRSAAGTKTIFDGSNQVPSGTDIRYELQVAEDDDQWVTIAEESVRLVVETTGITRTYPNPANPQIAIEFALSRSEVCRLDIYDVSGKLIRTLVAEELTAGTHTVIWSGRTDTGRLTPSGIYLARLRTESSDDVRRITVVQ